MPGTTLRKQKHKGPRKLFLAWAKVYEQFLNIFHAEQN